jgi:hypothetical protein
MTRTITIDIPVLIGSNGRWMSSGPDPDWGLLADCIMDDDKDPAQSKRYIVRVKVPVPTEADYLMGEVVEPK